MTTEQIYDEQIAPLMTQIIEICRAGGVSMIASFAIANEDDPNLRCTTHLPDGKGGAPFKEAYHALVNGRVPPMMLTTRNADGEVTSMTAVLG